MILHTEEKTKIESDGRVSLSKGPICDSGVENDSHHSYLQHLDASAHAEARIAGVIQVVGFGDASMWLEVRFFLMFLSTSFLWSHGSSSLAGTLLHRVCFFGGISFPGRVMFCISGGIHFPGRVAFRISGGLHFPGRVAFCGLVKFPSQVGWLSAWLDAGDPGCER